MKFYFLPLFLLCSLCARAQQLNLKNAGAITTVAYFNKGDSKTYHVTNTEQHFKNGSAKPDTESKTEYDITLTVIDSTEKSYTIQMVYSHYTLPADMSEADRELLKIAENLKIIYTTNELGVFESITNKKELVSAMSKLWDAIARKIDAKITDPEQKKELGQRLAGVKAMLSNENNVDALFSNDILMLHGMYGTEMSLNKTEKIEITFPVMENMNLKGTGLLTLREINKPKNECKFEVVQQPDKAELDKYIKNIFDMLIGSDLSEKADLSQFKFSSESRENYTMDLSNGWFRKVSTYSTSNVVYKTESRKTTNRTEYVLK